MVEAEILPAAPAFVPVSQVKTYFAPAGRDSRRELAEKAAVIDALPVLRAVINAMPNMVLVLNGNRQIVAANDAALIGLKATSADVAGERPGEAFGCIYASEGPDGCGTSTQCAKCGAVQAILDCQKGEKKSVEECRILAKSADGVAPRDLRVTVSPFVIDGVQFVMVAVEDISASKRLAVLQRTFFHDVLNTAGCIRGFAEYLASEGGANSELCVDIARLTDQLIESVECQRDLTRAESGDLKLHLETIHVPAFLEGLRSQYCRHSVAEGRHIRIANAWDGELVTDRLLLLRILANLLKNALEATAPGNTVTLACSQRPEGAEFAVHNPEVIPAEIQRQLFQRSFSTKGEPGRGIGTYSVKLFGERYLQGKVAFTSQAPQGTTFTLTLPRKLP